MNYEERYKQAIENFKKIKNANSDNKKLVNFIEHEYPELCESEDEKMRAMAIKAVHAPEAQSCIKSWGINPGDVIAWLEKQGEQKSVEWSEEDDDARDIAIRIIQNGGDNCAGILDSDKALNWLKSLKPQPHWKPSKEQMEALKKRTHGLHTSSETRKALESLINDLEKLRLC